MKIAIDARMYGPEFGGGGLGRYVEQLVTHLQDLDKEHEYTLFLKPGNAKTCTITNPNFTKEVVDIHWYTVKEQLKLPGHIDAVGANLVHFPHWNVPLRIKTPFVVTIHDLILLEQPMSAKAKATTRNPLVYWAKYAAYKRVLKHAVTASRHIIAVSDYTKAAIQKHFPRVSAEKISVIHEGVTDFPKTEDAALPKALEDETYFLYVGNAYPHKNLESLMHAFSYFYRLHPEVKLVLAGREDVFYERLKKELDEIDVPNEAVHFVMNPSDAKLRQLYENATLYLFPSKSEGFGLPPLEAMQLGVPVAAARTTSLPEILGDAALYFSPDDLEEMVDVMEQVLENAETRELLRKKGKKQVKKYAWSDMAAATQSIYKQIITESSP